MPTTIQKFKEVRLTITDNAYKDGREGWPLVQCFECNSDLRLIKKQIVDDLCLIGGKKLSDIIDENPDILVFPYSLSGKISDMGDLKICSYNPSYDRLYTGNLMGFVGVNDTQLTIKSRFSSENDDYFLHYMLMKVFRPNVLKLEHDTSIDSVFDFLLYMFPRFFNEALRQGLFKEYKKYQRNDLKVRGFIDVPRHIAHNIPFNGRIAYNIREYSYDNHITELIRHTIELIRHSLIGASILQDKETQTNCRIISDVTSSYSHSALRKILMENRQQLNHPYFTKYKPLQRLCISILNRHKLKYGVEKDKVYGILFDGAWLWEEYLNTIFSKWGMLHAENKTGKNPIYLFEENLYVRYPDFFKPNEVVIDAKYKRLGNKEIARDDIHQIISYLHVLNARSSFVAYPKDTGESSIDIIGTLKGLKGKIGQIGLKIPQEATSFHHFHSLMDGEKGEISKITTAWKLLNI